MKIKRPKKADALIPTGSMADIAFLLIIFFMVTTTHEVDRTSVNLPAATIREEAEKGAAIVVLAKDAAGEVMYKFSDGEQMSKPVNGPEDIYYEASQLTYGDAEKQFVLKADGSVKFLLIDGLLDRMREGNVKNVLLLTAQGSGQEGAS